MRCQYCGAEVKKGILKCEYCGCEVEQEQEEPKMSYESPESFEMPQQKERKSSLYKAVVGVYVAIVILVAGFMVSRIVFMSNRTDRMLDFVEDNLYEIEKEEKLEDKFPKNATDIVGRVESCTTTGKATIEYNSKSYYDVQILDTELIDWLTEIGASIDNVGIMFSTDEERNISKIALLSNKFIVMYQDGDHYVAYRGDDFITFTSDMELTVDTCYEGYFNYPDMHLYTATVSDMGTMAIMDPVCDEKAVNTVKAARTELEVEVYQIRVGADWYSCSKETYEELEVGASLWDYTFCGSGYNYFYE